jgi:4-aminobutyrate aminotransferase-like enzyme/Ser/Thr protein kinase RdoA (MazF antagonist)
MATEKRPGQNAAGMDFAIFDTPRPEVDTTTAEKIAEHLYRLDGVAQPLHGERDRSFRLETSHGIYVLKVGNGADRPDALMAQAGAMEHALVLDPELPLPRVIPTVAGATTGAHDGHAIQLTEFLDGTPPISLDTPPGFRRALGTLAARLSRALRGYDHPAFHRLFPWDMTRLSALAPLLAYVDPIRRGLLESDLDRFEREVLPIRDRMSRQPVHGDIHDDNIVVDPSDPERVVGLFDFGDMSWGPRVAELAVTAAYQCFGSDPVEAMAQVVSAYHVTDPLGADEIALLPDLVRARCVQSLLMAARHVATHPDNADYAGGDAEHMWATLTAIDRSDRDSTATRLMSACGVRARPRRSLEQALALRGARLGPALILSYDTPVRLHKGEGVWLIDQDGRRLLDAYNNVPHVGHAHPEVVSAMTAQARLLTTNTRYLVDTVNEYADRLAGLVPHPLSVVMFTNSGSEANDLAYQIAVAVTGHRGVITTRNAYHGATVATTAMSPEEYETPGHSAVVGGGTTLRGPDAAGLLRAELLEATRGLDARGETPAMAIFDTIFSSEGIFGLPTGYLQAARKWADGAGALLVADEVQAGFGRVGPRFWGFAAHDAVPDIVTLGKPMGNGYPMGAVITSAEIAAEFADRWHFFSTFAGSPMAAEVGNAVLDVIEHEMLADNAGVVGAYLRDRIAEIEHPQIVDVRGAGLFVGVELASFQSTRRVVQGMRERGVLIGSTGPDDNVLKIRPPLVFTKRHADMLVECLSTTLMGL